MLKSLESKSESELLQNLRFEISSYQTEKGQKEGGVLTQKEVFETLLQALDPEETTLPVRRDLFNLLNQCLKEDIEINLINQEIINAFNFPPLDEKNLKIIEQKYNIKNPIINNYEDLLKDFEYIKYYFETNYPKINIEELILGWIDEFNDKTLNVEDSLHLQALKKVSYLIVSWTKCI